MARVRSSTSEPTATGAAALAPRPARTGASKTRKPAPPPPARPHARQVAMIAGIGLCAFAAVALASWSGSDPSASVAAVGPVHNLGGRVGARLADLLYQGFGYAAWAVILVGARLALRLAARPPMSWLATLLSGAGFWMAATALELALGAEGRAFPAGGLLGMGTAALLSAQVGEVGAAMVVTVALIACATLLFRIDWQPLVARAVDRVEVGAPAAARLVGAAGARVVRVGVQASSSVASGLKERMEARRLAAQELAPVEEEAEEDPDTGVADASVWSARPAPPPRLLPQRTDDAPTHVGGRTLVEVEVDRTSAVDTAPRAPAIPGMDAPIRRAPEPRPEPVDARAPRAEPAPRPAWAEAPPRLVPPATEDDLFDDELRPGLPELGDRVVDLPPPRAETPLARPARLDDDYDVAPPPPPAPAVEARPAAIQLEDPAPERPMLPLPAFDAPEARPRKKGGIAIVPGNLESGGARDDGAAVRHLNQPFQLPPLGLLDDHPVIVAGTDEARLRDLAKKLTAKLQDFGVEGRVTSIRPGPVITMFEYEPAPGIKLSKIAALADDVAMALKALGIRIVAPIPGRGVVGVEVPNEVRQTVWARDVFAAPEFREGRHSLPIVLGKDTEGRPYVTDLARTPHLLVGGTTGSGKSVGINAMLISMLLTRTPEELRLILIDPKMLEFELYKDIPHLLHPVVTEAKLASKVLAWACEEMDHRYRLLGDWKVRNIESFNEKVEHESKDWTPEKARSYYPDWPEGSLLPIPRKLPYIVVVIDELADLMMVASKDVEMSIARLAQKARASGIHLIVATQRPSADVITGLIRSNMPSRLAYQVRTKTESRIILDQNGADALLGKGDLLFLPPGVSGLTRIHGPFLADDEVRRVADHLRLQGPPNYAPAIRLDEDGGEDGDLEELDEEMGGFYNECVDLAIEKGQISTSMIQRHLKIGYNRACLLMEQLERQGVVGPADGAKPRKVLIRD